MHVIYQQTRSNFTRLSGYKKDIVIHSFSQGNVSVMTWLSI